MAYQFSCWAMSLTNWSIGVEYLPATKQEIFSEEASMLVLWGYWTPISRDQISVGRMWLRGHHYFVTVQLTCLIFISWRVGRTFPRKVKRLAALAKTPLNWCSLWANFAIICAAIMSHDLLTRWPQPSVLAKSNVNEQNLARICCLVKKNGVTDLPSAWNKVLVWFLCLMAYQALYVV